MYETVWMLVISSHVIVCLNGVPINIISDRDSKDQVYESFLEDVWNLRQFDTSCHPQTSGRAEGVNRSSEKLSRSHVGKNIHQWDLLIISPIIKPLIVVHLRASMTLVL